MKKPVKREQKVVYIAGPFRASSSWGIELNIRRAEELALLAWTAGFAVICPHANTRFYQGALPDEVWLDGDLEILRRCDAVLLVDGWEKSKGTAGEVAVAREEGIPVFEDIRELMEWERRQICATL